SERVQGVWPDPDQDVRNYLTITLSSGLRQDDVLTGDKRWTGFLIKSWAPSPLVPPLGQTYAFNLLPADMSTFVGAHQYNWIPGPQVDQAGSGNLPGQSEQKPASWFVNHQLVRYSPDSFTWYDPSYGVVYQPQS